MARSESLLANSGLSRTSSLKFFDRAISGLVKTCMYDSLAMASHAAWGLVSPVNAMAFPVGIRLIIAFCSFWSSFRCIRIKITPVGSSMNGSY